MKDPIFWLAISISLIGVSQVINTANERKDVRHLEQRCDSMQIQIDKCYTNFKTRTK